jgi:hypothetical protein
LADTNLTRGQDGLITGDPNGGVSAEETSEGLTAGGSTAAEGSSEGIPTGPTSEEASPAAGSSEGAQIPAPVIPDPNAVPEYTMSRGWTLSREHIRSIWMGFSPVLPLEEKYGHRWRKLNTESVYYGCRLPLYCVFEKLLVEKKWDKDAFITRLECLMQKAGSLRRFCDRSKKVLKVLKDETKAGTTATAPDILVT